MIVLLHYFKMKNWYFLYRKKGYLERSTTTRFPSESVKLILKKFNLNLNDIEAIVFYEKPLVKFDRLIESYVHYAQEDLNLL